MKTIAYSEIPRNNPYVHLAYLSATSEQWVGGTLIGFGMFLGALALFVLVIGSKLKLAAKAPRLWRWLGLALLLAALLALGLGYLDRESGVPSFYSPTLMVH